VIIKGYGDIPPTYVPDIGEVVRARRSVTDAWTNAAVIQVQRRRNSMLKFIVQWLGDNPYAGDGTSPVVVGDTGYIRTTTDGEPLLIQRISRDDL
jgi:hypothetical protein